VGHTHRQLLSSYGARRLDSASIEFAGVFYRWTTV